MAAAEARKTRRSELGDLNEDDGADDESKVDSD